MTHDSLRTTLSLGAGTLRPVPLVDAVRRVRSYCTHPASGWSVYDLAAIHARDQGHFGQVRPWDLL